jgi:alpha-N-arabinofuranosidase
VNFGNKAVDLNITVAGLESGIRSSGSKQTVLTSATPLDENSFQQPEKVSTKPVVDHEFMMVDDCSCSI